MRASRARVRWDVAVVAVMLVLPLVIRTRTGQIADMFIFAILALALNVCVGFTGLLQLGIAAFFGLGVYATGILTVPSYPFQAGFLAALVVATCFTAVVGIVVGAPLLRLRGDYLAVVTLGFAEVVKITLRNLEEITAGMKGLIGVPPPQVPGWLNASLGAVGLNVDFVADDRWFYYMLLGILVAVVILLYNLSTSRIGREWIALREDELAAACIGINPAKVKLGAFALSSGLAGLAGCLYATKLASTADPNAFDFNRSITMLCCVILGGLGSLRGTLLGVAILIGFDTILAGEVDSWLQRSGLVASGNPFLTFSGWRLMVFGLALVLVMRFRPEGLLPSTRMVYELHEESDELGGSHSRLPRTEEASATKRRNS